MQAPSQVRSGHRCLPCVEGAVTHTVLQTRTWGEGHILSQVIRLRGGELGFGLSVSPQVEVDLHVTEGTRAARPDLTEGLVPPCA